MQISPNYIVTKNLADAPLFIDPEIACMALAEHAEYVHFEMQRQLNSYTLLEPEADSLLLAKRRMGFSEWYLNDDEMMTESEKEKEVEKEEVDHGWWCDEHGVKEADCSMCSAKVAKACRDKGDWCKDHNRAKSQCFICDPSLQAKFAGDYRAKFGKEPPDPTENKAEKK